MGCLSFVSYLSLTHFLLPHQFLQLTSTPSSQEVESATPLPTPPPLFQKLSLILDELGLGSNSESLKYLLLKDPFGIELTE